MRTHGRDLIEGNAKAVQATLHTTKGRGADGRSCNQDGCFANVGKDGATRYGPGARGPAAIDSSSASDTSIISSCYPCVQVACEVKRSVKIFIHVKEMRQSYCGYQNAYRAACSWGSETPRVTAASERKERDHVAMVSDPQNASGLVHLPTERHGLELKGGELPCCANPDQKL